MIVTCCLSGISSLKTFIFSIYVFICFMKFLSIIIIHFVISVMNIEDAFWEENPFLQSYAYYILSSCYCYYILSITDEFASLAVSWQHSVGKRGKLKDRVG